MTEEKKAEIQVLKDDISLMINDNNKSTLSLDNNLDDLISFTTRENGDVGSGEFGAADFDDAIRMEEEFIKKHGSKIITTIETVDEWVNLIIRFK